MKILYLVHRLPYPPNKGDKVRSYHLLRHLVQQGHQVLLGSFIDDPEDWQHLPTLRTLCADLHVEGLSPRWSKLMSLTGLMRGEALGLRYYRNPRLQRWVDAQVQSGVDAILVFSSTMAQYALPHNRLPLLVDFVDMDSAKWRDYAPRHAWPLSWLYAREGRELLRFERLVAERTRASYFVTDAECALFRAAAPESSERVQTLCNGVDAEFFDPALDLPNPYGPDELPIVFTGAMDYWPNVDAVQWFVAEMLPQLRQRHARLRFHIVGRAPTAAVQALAGESVHVSGTVPDVRPYLRHAAAVVAPLRLARGIQNKVLEAMAMARPVVAATSCVVAIDAVAGQELAPAERAEDYVAQLLAWLDAPGLAAEVGRAARERVVARYAWGAQLARLDRELEALA
ncbi:MAG: TIGR03087 family PEP-CTERM/XrtA system glycosyltransferase [Inhella sp.]